MLAALDECRLKGLQTLQFNGLQLKHGCRHNKEKKSVDEQNKELDI